MLLLQTKMALKTVLAKFQHRILKMPHEEIGSNSSGSVGSKDPQFIYARGSSVPKGQPQKKQEGKKTSKKRR